MDPADVRRGLPDRLRLIVPGWKAARNPTESFYGPRMDLSPTALPGRVRSLSKDI